VDDLSSPYYAGEIEAVRAAIDKCGRPIVFSTSPGETPLESAAHVQTNANQWRISGDFWDDWKSLDHNFDLLAAWRGAAAPGHWPDADMIPLGHVGERSVGGSRMSRFTRDEQVTMMSLWALAPSPLMLGMDLPQNDPWTLSLLTNDEVLAVNQDALGRQGHRVSQANRLEVWVKDLSGRAKAVGLFNRGPDEIATVSVPLPALGFAGPCHVRDLWSQKDAADATGSLARDVPPHGAVVIRLDPIAK
jgi:hypothetical protein